MVVAALWHERSWFPSTPDTGALAGDMKALLANTSQQIAAVGRDVILGLVTELPPGKAFGILGESDPERLVYVDELVARARARGEVGPQPLPDAVRRAPLSLARYHAIVSGGLGWGFRSVSGYTALTYALFGTAQRCVAIKEI